MRNEQAIKGLKIRVVGDIVVVDDGGYPWACGLVAWEDALSLLSRLEAYENTEDGVASAYDDLCHSVEGTIVCRYGGGSEQGTTQEKNEMREAIENEGIW